MTLVQLKYISPVRTCLSLTANLFSDCSCTSGHSTVNVEILAIHLIWRFGNEQLNLKPPIFLCTHDVIPNEAKIYPGSIEIFRRRRHRQPEVGLKTSISEE